MTGRDGLDILTEKRTIQIVRIFADGSTMIRFDGLVRVGIYQSVAVYDL